MKNKIDKNYIREMLINIAHRKQNVQHKENNFTKSVLFPFLPAGNIVKKKNIHDKSKEIKVI